MGQFSSKYTLNIAVMASMKMLITLLLLMKSRNGQNLTSVTPAVSDSLLRKCFFSPRTTMNGENGTYFCVHLFVAQFRKIF